MMIERYKRDLIREFHNYDKMMLMKDLMAGLTVTAVAIPLALAFGVGSGATAASGLVTAIIAGVIISALGGAYFQISGPTGAMAAILMSIIAQYPMPVISGFTSGIAVIIAMGQIDNFFGVKSVGSSVTEKFLSYFELGFEPNMTAVGIGVFVMLMMLLFPIKYSKFIPSSLFAIIVATAANIALNLDVAVVGEIPATLLLDDRLQLASLLDFRTVIGLLAPAVSIAVLAMIESLLCGATASRMTGARLDSNRELVAQGVGNIIVPFFGGIPATAAIARTSVAVKSGAVTRMTGIFHALGILLAMFVLAPVMSQIPLAALAGVLMVVSWRMNEWVTINFILKGKFKGAILKFVVTMLTTIIVDLTTAIMIGVIIGLVLQAVRFSHLRITYDEIDPQRLHEEAENLPEDGLVCYINGPIVFANTERLEEIPKKAKRYGYVYFSMRGVPDIDISGVQEFAKIVQEMKDAGKKIYLCSLQDEAMEMLKRGGVYKMIGQDAVYWSVERALLDRH